MSHFVSIAKGTGDESEEAEEKRLTSLSHLFDLVQENVKVLLSMTS